MIDWGQIFYGATLTAAFTAVAFVLTRQRKPAVLAAAVAAAFVGPLAWNAILHRTRPGGFFVDIPFKPFPVSWQDTGSGVFTLALASMLLALAQPRATAARAATLALQVAAVALLVDIYLY